MRFAAEEVETTERRRFDRVRRRVVCRLRWGGSLHPGWVRDLAPGGLLVQARLRPPEGAHVEVELRPDDEEPFWLTAVVVHFEASHPSVRAVMPPTIGLRIVGAPEAYFRLLLASPE